MRLTIGSKRLSNTDGVIGVRGDEQIVFEWGALHRELLLTMDLYDVRGYHIARLRRNQWTFNDLNRFVFAASARGVNLVDTKSGEVALEARVVGGDAVAVTQGAFHSCAGHKIEIKTEAWHGALPSQTAKSRSTESTNPPFTRRETESIRRAVASSQEKVECPRCGCPLTRDRLSWAVELDSLLVSCNICGRNLVVRRQS